MTQMPRNLVHGSAPEPEPEPERDDAALEARWLAENLPAEPLQLRWRYNNRTIQLYERHLRSFVNYRIGPALRSYLRTRLEWVNDNKLWEKPSGVIVVDVDPGGDVDVTLADAEPAPTLTVVDLRFEDGALAGASVPGSLWVRPLGTGAVHCVPGLDKLKGASETLVRDLTTTLGYELAEGTVSKAEVEAEGTETLLVNDEFGILVIEGHEGSFTAKMQSCFEKLWSQGK